MSSPTTTLVDRKKLCLYECVVFARRALPGVFVQDARDFVWAVPLSRAHAREENVWTEGKWRRLVLRW